MQQAMTPANGIIRNNIGNTQSEAKIDFDLYDKGTWEALDSSELIAFDAGVFLDTLATQSENLFPRHFLTLSTPSPNPTNWHELALSPTRHLVPSGD